ncbi:MAG TPA: LamG domain-containing protein [bacterium]|nr:LamG domain-containing protein [bacterium]
MARDVRLVAIVLVALGLLLQQGVARLASRPAGSASGHDARPPLVDLRFAGSDSYVEVPSSPDFSLGAAGLTVAVWMRPDVLTFSKTEGSQATEQYVHWLGKGERGQYEWTFRMYSLSTPPGPRQNRISFYVFQPSGGRGCGSYFQDPITPGEWIQVVGVADAATRQTAIYKNGRYRHSDSYATLTLGAASAPFRIGTRDLASFFQGAIGPVRIWDRPLREGEIHALYTSGVVPSHGLKAQFLLNEGTGTVVRDTERGHEGRMIGARWDRGVHSVGTATGRSGGGC